MTRQLGFWPFVFTTFCLVSGGPYGSESVIGELGVSVGLGMMLLLPLIWGLPVALVSAELGAAMPVEGGFYQWVKLALGERAGFLSAWWSLMYAIVDAALYPTMFAKYFVSAYAPGLHGFAQQGVSVAAAAFVIVLVTWLNIRGIRDVGRFATLLASLILIPFGFMVLNAGVGVPSLNVRVEGALISVGLATAMWNYLGFDNLSTVGGEVSNPARTIPRGLLVSLLLIVVAYMLPMLAGLKAVPDPSEWPEGAWPQIATRAGGEWVGKLVLFGGLISPVAMFASQMLATSRLPLSFAKDGILPKALSELHPKFGTPWKSLVLCGLIFSGLSWFSFSELITANVLLYSVGIVHEFIAIIRLRLTQPELHRPFKIQGGIPALILLAIPPFCLSGFVVFQSIAEEGWMKQIPTGLAILSGPLLWWWIQRSRRHEREDRLVTGLD